MLPTAWAGASRRVRLRFDRAHRFNSFPNGTLSRPCTVDISLISTYATTAAELRSKFASLRFPRRRQLSALVRPVLHMSTWELGDLAGWNPVLCALPVCYLLLLDSCVLFCRGALKLRHCIGQGLPQWGRKACCHPGLILVLCYQFAWQVRRGMCSLHNV